LGNFKVENSLMAPVAGGPKILVKKTIEKQTDVTIGADMVHDAHNGLSDVIALLSNDSDQRRPLEIVRELGKEVIVMNPNPSYPAYDLHKNAHQVRKITQRGLQQAQFPRVVSHEGCSYAMPGGWYRPDGITPAQH
jgi:uncharacterized LabA/DUF88 family protein